MELDVNEIKKWWDIFRRGGEITEIRVLFGKKTFSGYFNNVESIIQQLTYIDQENVQTYFAINKVKQSCFYRAQRGVIKTTEYIKTTADYDIESRMWVMIDLDPKRPAGISSSNEELELARQKAHNIFNYLKAEGFNEPVVCMSGNGYHIMIPCDIPVNKYTTETIKKFTKVLSLMFSDDNVEVDESVFNPSRICKLYGTIAKKGSNTEERPWRMSKIVYVPKGIKPVPIEYFQKVASLYPESPKPTRENGYNVERFDLVSFLNRHGIAYRETSCSDGRKFILEHCPFNEQHKGKDAAIFQSNSGAIGFFCFHNSCSGKTWRDVRLLYEPDAYDRPTPQRREYKAPTDNTPIVETPDKGTVWLKMSEVKRAQVLESDFIPSGIVYLDRKGLGFKKGMVSVFTGKRGCGKSSLLNMLILNSAQTGHKTALWTGELTADFVKQWLYLQAAGKGNNERYLDTDYFITKERYVPLIDAWLDKYLRLFNNKYGERFSQIEEQIRILHKDWGLDSVMLDNLMVLDIRSLDENKYDRQSILLQRLCDLAKELHIHIHIVAHPHKSNGYIRIDNISGSGDITNKADNVFVLSRVDNDFKAGAPEYLDKTRYNTIVTNGCTNVIEVAKFRAKGTLVGDLIPLWFELESNRLKNTLVESINYAWNEPPKQTSIQYDDDPIGPMLTEAPY